MPRVKIDYVVSFSSEDPEHQASNLLSWEVSKKKWLCRAGEPACSVVLQLARAVQISSVQVGAHHAALVEVLVGRSETPGEPYQVLVPSSVFLSPAESRGGEGAARVRSFGRAALAAAAAQRWDRLRVVCSQPYNKHCKYGLSFIHVFEPEGEAAPPPAAPAGAAAVPPRLLALDTFSSDEDDFRPGELFAEHRQSGGDTGAQIRQATSQAYKNNPEATKLIKTSISKRKPTTGTPEPERTAPPAPRRDKRDLVYTGDDDRPHAKIDHVVQRHRDERCKDEAKTPKPKEIDKGSKTPQPKRDQPSSSRNSEAKNEHNDSRNQGADDIRQLDKNGVASIDKAESRKRHHSDRNRSEKAGAGDEELGAGPACDQPLRGVVFVLSGYQNPRRARLRDLAVSLGARCQPHWGPHCTHLICAFSKTPKLAAVRAAAGGGAVPAPTAAWLEACARRRRRLPWRWFAAEPQRRLPLPPAADAHSDRSGSESDTDDEIEKVLRQQKKARPASTSPPPCADPPSPSPDSASPPQVRPGAKAEDSDDVEFVKDERMQGKVTVEDSESGGDTDVEAGPGAGARGAGRAALPDLFAGRRFVVQAELTAPLDAPLLARYCVAYGGLVLKPSDMESVDEECYVLVGRRARGAAARGLRLRACWLWACHAAGTLLPTTDYLVHP